jgi:hypothetical protein
VSQENVEVIERLVERLSDPAQDFASRVRNDAQWQAWIEEVAPFFHSDWETVRRTALGDEGIHSGFEGSRALWLGWLEPWESYRVVVERVIDCGERILGLTHDHARPWGSEAEVVLPSPAGVWTFRDGRIARLDIYDERDEALKAVGLEEG